MKFPAQPNALGEVAKFITKDVSFTLDRTFHTAIFILTNASDIDITVKVGPELGYTCTFIRAGNGAVTFVADSGVTINSVDGSSSLDSWAITRLFCYDSNSFILHKSGSSGSGESRVTRTTLNADNETSQDLYTIPGGRQFILSRLVFTGASDTFAGIAGSGQYTGVGYNGEPYSNDVAQIPDDALAMLIDSTYAVVYTVDAVGNGYVAGKIGNGGDTLRIKINSASALNLGTTVLVDVYGYLI